MIRRMLVFTAMLAISLSAIGCNSNKSQAEKQPVPARSEPVAAIPPAPEPYVPLPAYNPPPSDSTVYIPPAPSPAPKTAAAKPSASAKTYTVQKGDTLTSIARKVYGNPAKYKDIAAANGISDPNKIKAGQVLTLP